MPHSLRSKIKKLRYEGIITDKDCDRLCKALDNEECLEKIRAEQESKTNYKAFAEWVAGEIFSETWKFNKDAFAEVACRKLSEMGIVKADGENWILEQEPITNANTPHLTVDEYIRTRNNK